VAAHRQNRPWNGETVRDGAPELPDYVPDCYLCPGNLRVSGARNDDYEQVFVFDNDHPCVGMDAPADLAEPVGIYRNRPARGIARVVCYSPKHNLSLAQLNVDQIVTLMRSWQEQYRELGTHPEVNYVMIFENRGEVVGVSNPHPHCQIYATNFVFTTIAKEIAISQRVRREEGRHIFDQIIAAEQEDGRRIIAENEHAIAFLPYFARYAYEAFVAPKVRHPHLGALSEAELVGLAQALKALLTKYDNLWRMPFPYIMVLHQAPTDGQDYSDYHFHIQFQPPMRKPNLLKYLGGPETGGGNFLSDTSAEEKAAELIAAPAIHYREADNASDR